MPEGRARYPWLWDVEMDNPEFDAIPAGGTTLSRGYRGHRYSVGKATEHPTLGLLDARENILANKLTALVDRCAPKDAADIYWLCCVDGLSLPAALEGASGKASGIFPPLVAEALERGRLLGVPEVFWIRRPDPARFDEGMRDLVASLVP